MNYASHPACSGLPVWAGENASLDAKGSRNLAGQHPQDASYFLIFGGGHFYA
jgi:hypothetical protein